MEVRTRIAPSPTGSPHIGTAWQALFDFVFAKKNSGKFILRLEDTDRVRLVPESEKQIYETLQWLGLEIDESPLKGGNFGPYIQSERLDIYKKYAHELLEKGLAYKDEGAVKFKINREGSTSYHDLVGGKDVSIENSTQDDFVIIKSDGYPTYNFANVIDDHLMEISHVIRGNEYISSMPKYIQLYKSFAWNPPQFAHLPLLVGSDRAKLSKRHGAKGALEYKQDGYLKEAVINFLALLGWSHPEGEEIFTISDMIEVFDFKNFNSASAYFDETKLDWMNGEYIRKMSDEDLAERLENYLKEIDHIAKNIPTEDELLKLVPLIKERIKKLSDFIPLTDFFFGKPEYDMGVFKKLKITDMRLAIEKTLEKLDQLKSPWDPKEFEETFKALAIEMKISNLDMFQLIRVAVSGQLVTPPLFESIEILGEEESKMRVRELIKFIEKSVQV